jgi:hypothetical protein
MTGRRVIVYYAWSKPEEAGAPLEIIDNRFPTLFESRRMLHPTFEELSDPARFDQSVAGFLDNILKRNYAAFVEQASTETGLPVVQVERIAGNGRKTVLDANLLEAADISSSLATTRFELVRKPTPMRSELCADFSRIRII